MSTHLGEALGTDFFSVRDQFSDEQWRPFIATRRFVDTEVLPVISGYWERAEFPWELIKRWVFSASSVTASRGTAARR